MRRGKSAADVYAEGGGNCNMHLHRDFGNRINLEDGVLSNDVVSEGVHIEKILQRAHQIHRDRGGLIGYDLEDWQQAEQELIGEFRQAVNE
jgi:hypothetical protein